MHEPLWTVENHYLTRFDKLHGKGLEAHLHARSLVAPFAKERRREVPVQRVASEPRVGLLVFPRLAALVSALSHRVAVAANGLGNRIGLVGQYFEELSQRAANAGHPGRQNASS